MARHRLRMLRQEMQLPLGVTVIGRSLHCDIRLDDRLVSRRHARIVVSADRALVEDLASRNGVDVNGTRIDGLTLLRDRDLVRIGKQVFVFCQDLSGAGALCGTPEPRTMEDPTLVGSASDGRESSFEPAPVTARGVGSGGTQNAPRAIP